MYRAPVFTSVVFLALLTAFTVGSAATRTVSEQIGDSPSPNTPEPASDTGCPTVCPLGERCDEERGACVAVERTPIPCAEGSTYDEEQGFCVPDPTPQPTAPPTRTLSPEELPQATQEPERTPEPEAEAPDSDDDDGDDDEDAEDDAEDDD